MAWTEVDDVEARWVSSDEHRASTATIQAWIDDAETVIRYEFPDIEDRIEAEDDPLPVERVKLVVCSMVRMVLSNPDNARSITTGPFGKTFAGDTPGGLWLTDDERGLLSASETQPGGAFAIDTVSTSTAIVHADICAINFGATYCSCGAILTQGWPLYETGGW